jgi:hypothetical protein
MSFAVASNWLWNFGIAYATPYLVNPTTTGVNGVKAADLGVKVFFIWGSTCVGCLIFTLIIPNFRNLLCADRKPLLDTTSFLRRRVCHWSKLTSYTASRRVWIPASTVLMSC